MSFLQKVYDRTLKMANIVLPNQKKIGKQTSSPAYQDYRAGERNAEQIAADYERRKAEQDYRAGERSAMQYQNGVQQAGKEVQYDLTGWMPLVINRNLNSEELMTMRLYNDWMQRDLGKNQQLRFLLCFGQANYSEISVHSTPGTEGGI